MKPMNSLWRVMLVFTLALPMLAQEKKPDPYQGVYEDAQQKKRLLLSEPVKIEALKGMMDYFGDMNVDGRRISFDAGIKEEGKLMCLVKKIDDKEASGIFLILIKDGLATIDSPDYGGKHTLKRYAMTVAEAKKIMAERAGKPEIKPAPVDNPLAKTDDTPKPPVDPFCGKFSNPRLSLELALKEGSYSGTIQMGANQYPITATKSGEKLAGTFTSGASKFDVTITATEKGVTLTTGGVDHALARAGADKPRTPDNPLAVDEPKVTPKAKETSTQGELGRKLCGKWLTRTNEMEVSVTFNSDGTGRRSVRTVAGKQVSEFTWRIDGKKVVVKTDEGDTTPLTLTFETDTTITLLDEDGDGLRMVRQE